MFTRCCLCWNKNNEKSVTTERNYKWKIDTLRNYADSLELYDREKGKDIKIDEILMTRINNCRLELEQGRIVNNEICDTSKRWTY